MNSEPLKLPQLFKGIALFTPGGDLIYCLDPDKKSRWHTHLCAALQGMLGLSESPHFLVPSYTATIDKWLEPGTQKLRVSAEAYPPVLKYQTLLNSLFNTENLVWEAPPRSEEFGDPLVMGTYYEQFPQLWENHDLVVRFEPPKTDGEPATLSTSSAIEPNFLENLSLFDNSPEVKGYVFRLFVSSNSMVTKQTLENLHQILENYLGYPYTLKVIDVFKHPEQADADRISATPTLIRLWPKPVRRIVGQCDDVEKIIQLLHC
ncbi:MAG: circadian clock protein KaiB [Okeania sp. SIO2H7]|nr:circadian clock protein KaiB [Okeania sp. SIO2H7]